MEEREGNHFGMFGRLTGVSSGSSSEPSSLSEFLLVGAAVFLLIGVGFVVAAVERDKEEGEEVAVAEPRGLIPKVPPARSFDGLDHGRRCRGVHSSISRLLDLPKRSSVAFCDVTVPSMMKMKVVWYWSNLEESAHRRSSLGTSFQPSCPPGGDCHTSAVKKSLGDTVTTKATGIQHNGEEEA